MSQSPLHRPASRAFILYTCFFFSGAAGLIYEVVWSRYLMLYLGGTGTAHTMILATYMGGLALGAFLFGRVVDKVASPLKLYVGLELGIALLGLLYPMTFEPVRALFLGIVRLFDLNPTASNLAAMLCSALTLLLPTTLMGGTLPVLGRYLIRNESAIGHRIAILYYLNSFGAVVGSLFAGFYLVEAVGLAAAMYIAAVLNLIVVAVARVLHMLDQKTDAAEGTSTEIAEKPETENTQSYYQTPAGWTPARITLLVIGVSGFASMVYEVAWIRLLSLVLGSSSYSFSLMLAAFIFGITLGSFLLSLKKTDEGYFGILGWCELGIGLTALISIIFYQRLPFIFNQWRTALAPIPDNFWLYQTGKFTLCFAVMVVPTVFMGATVPAASRVVAREVNRLGKNIGNVFAINTVGTLLGAIAGGFILLPLVGIRRTVELAVCINLVIGVWVTLAAARSGDLPRKVFPVALTLTLVVPGLYFAIAPEWDHRTFLGSTYRLRDRLESQEQLEAKMLNRDVLWYKDGTDASIGLVELPTATGGTKRMLMVNNKPDASNDIDMTTQALIAHLPMLLHPDPKEVFVLGLGSGVSAGAASLYDINHMDCVELIPEVVEAAKFFEEESYYVLDNEKVDIHVQDGKTFLQVTDKRYDVIINQPTNPWISGVAGLFTTEYFEIARDRLNDDGLFLQWMQVYEIEDRTVFDILRTFNHVFPYSTLVAFNSFDVGILGSMTPFEPDFQRMEQRMATGRVGESLTAIGIEGLLPILAMQMVAKNDNSGPYVSPLEIDYYLAGNPYSPDQESYLSDFFPRLEYEAARGFFIQAEAVLLKQLDRRSWSPARSGLWIADYKPSVPPTDSLFIRQFNYLRRLRSVFDGQLEAWCDLWEQYHPDSEQLAQARILVGEPAALATLQRLDRTLNEDHNLAIPQRLGLLMDIYESKRDFAGLEFADELREAATLATATNERNGLADLALGDLSRDAGKPEKAIEHYQAALQRTVSGARVGDLNSIAIEMRIADVLIDLNQLDAARVKLAHFRNTKMSSDQRFKWSQIICRLLQVENREGVSNNSTAPGV